MRDITVYCHFSFRRKKKEPGKILMSVAFYLDAEGKNLVAQRTVKRDMWEDQQFVCAIQSYEYALYTIFEWQLIMRRKGINQVNLVTDNSTLAGWIEEPRKNKEYTYYMNLAVENYKITGKREISLGIGLCEPWKYERSYKFCADRYVVEEDIDHGVKKNGDGNLLDIGSKYGNVTTAIDYGAEESEPILEIV